MGTSKSRNQGFLEKSPMYALSILYVFILKTNPKDIVFNRFIFCVLPMTVRVSRKCSFVKNYLKINILTNLKI